MAETVAEQIEILKRGTVEVFREEELVEKLTEAAKKGRQFESSSAWTPPAPIYTSAIR